MSLERSIQAKESMAVRKSARSYLRIAIGKLDLLGGQLISSAKAAQSLLTDSCRMVTDGVVLIDPDDVKNRKVFGHVLAVFKYGREDLDVLGLSFRKDLYLAADQIYPVVPGSQQRELTRLQERLIRKLGSNAYPFYFELPPHCPASVTLQPAPGDTGKPCGVDYEFKAFVGVTQDEKPHKRYDTCVP